MVENEYLRTHRLPAAAAPRVSSTGFTWISLALLCGLALLNGLVAGELGKPAGRILYWAANWYSTHSDGNIFKWIGLFIPFFLFCGLSAAIVYPLFLPHRLLAATGKTPGIQTGLGVVLAFAAGLLLSEVMPWSSWSQTASQYPWVFVCPGLLLLSSFTFSALDPQRPVCNTCGRWYELSAGEWSMATQSSPAMEDDGERLRLKSDVVLKYHARGQKNGSDDKLEKHRATDNALSMRLARCPICRNGVVHLARIKPTVYFVVGATECVTLNVVEDLGWRLVDRENCDLLERLEKTPAPAMS